MEVARLQSMVESLARARSNLVLGLIGGEQGPGVVNGAQALGYDLLRPHRVVTLACPSVNGGDVDAFFRAVSRAAETMRAGSLLASRLSEVILLADADVQWEQFRSCVVAESHGAPCSVGVGGVCLQLSDFPRSYSEAQISLRIQRTVCGTEQVTVFDELGVYQVLTTATDAAAMERFVGGWLGSLM